MTVQDLYRVLVDSQFIEIYKPSTGETCGKWSGRAKDIPSCYFESKIIHASAALLYKYLQKCLKQIFNI